MSLILRVDRDPHVVYLASKIITTASYRRHTYLLQSNNCPQQTKLPFPCPRSRSVISKQKMELAYHRISQVINTFWRLSGILKCYSRYTAGKRCFNATALQHNHRDEQKQMANIEQNELVVLFCTVFLDRLMIKKRGVSVYLRYPGMWCREREIRSCDLTYSSRT